MPVLHQHDNDSDVVKIAHDKEKTKRFTLYIGSLVLVAIVGIYFVFLAGKGSVIFDKHGVKISIDKPITGQIDQPTNDYKSSKGDIKFTTGKVDPSVIKQLETENVTFSPTTFAGKNFVNQDAGFLFSVDFPEDWHIFHNPNDRLGSAVIINNFKADDGNNLNVVMEQLPAPMDLPTYIDKNIEGLFSMGLANERPQISFDAGSNTVFFAYTNLRTGGLTYQKLILSGLTSYIATANFVPNAVENRTTRDMTQMIATFTLIGN